MVPPMVDPRHGQRSARALARLALAACLAATAPAMGADEATAFWAEVAEPGVYGVSHPDLVAAGMAPRVVPSAAIGVSCAGLPVPVRVEDGGDGAFGPGDSIEWVGEMRPGEGAPLDHHSGLNVYRLDLGSQRPLRMEALHGSASRDLACPQLWRTLHLEQDLERARLSPRQEPAETLLWARLQPTDREPLAIPVDLPDLDSESAAHASLRVHLEGWSSIPDRPPELTDHVVELGVNGRVVAVARWNTRDGDHTLIVPDVPTAALVAGANTLTLCVPRREVAGQGLVIDSVLLDWVELEYPRRSAMLEEQTAFALREPAGKLCLGSGARRQLALYGPHGLWAASGAAPDPAGVVEIRGELPAGPYHVVPEGGLLSPRTLEADHPWLLSSPERQADYIVIGHRRLLAAVAPLVELHRSRGLAVEVVDVADVYREFSHGLVHPSAIRAFLEHAFHHWRPPAPRFVLLVGDASWNVRQGGDGSRPLAGPSPHHRNLVPTMALPAELETTASDSWLASVDGDDERPDLAIGRLPVVEPAEVAGIVAKTVRYMTAAEPGPWRRSVLWIADSSHAPRLTDVLSGQLSLRGLAPDKLQAAPGQVAEPGHRSRLLAALDRGHLVIHFAGHGGRFNWRTTPADLVRGEDVLRMEDLDRLSPRAGLPVVLSMTCASAPFDHPVEDSIGEKLLRLPDRGAVAVVAASGHARSTSTALSRLLMEALLDQPTVGEALLRAKRQTAREEFVRVFNLLGDPALPLQLPRHRVDLEPSAAGSLSVLGRVDLEPFAGTALVEWVDAAGDPVAGAELEVGGSRFTAAFPEDAASAGRVEAVRVYAWEELSGRDAIGGISLAEERPRQQPGGRQRRGDAPVAGEPGAEGPTGRGW